MPEKWLFPIFLCHILSQWPSVAWLAQLLSSSMDATSSLCKLLGFLFRQVPRRAIHPGLQCSEAMSIQPARYLHLHFQSPIYIRIIPVWPGWGTPHIFGGGFLDNYRDWQSHSPGPHSCSQGVFFFSSLCFLQRHMTSSLPFVLVPPAGRFICTAPYFNLAISTLSEADTLVFQSPIPSYSQVEYNECKFMCQFRKH